MFRQFFVILSILTFVVVSKPMFFATLKPAPFSRTSRPVHSNLVGRGITRGVSFAADEDNEPNKKFTPMEDKNKFFSELPDTKQFFAENDASENSYHKNADFNGDHKPLKPHHSAGFKNAYHKDDGIGKFYDDAGSERSEGFLTAPRKSSFEDFNNRNHYTKLNDNSRFFKEDGRMSTYYDEGPFDRGYNPQRKFSDKYDRFFQRNIGPREGSERYAEEYLHPYRGYRLMAPSYYRGRLPLKTRLSMYENSDYFPGRDGSLPAHPAEIFY